MCSMAETSMPRRSPLRHVSCAASRRSDASASAAASDVVVISAIANAGGSGSVRSTALVITPSVPSEPMKRSTMSIGSAAK